MALLLIYVPPGAPSLISLKIYISVSCVIYNIYDKYFGIKLWFLCTKFDIRTLFFKQKVHEILLRSQCCYRHTFLLFRKMFALFSYTILDSLLIIQLYSRYQTPIHGEISWPLRRMFVTYILTDRNLRFECPNAIFIYSSSSKL